MATFIVLRRTSWHQISDWRLPLWGFWTFFNWKMVDSLHSLKDSQAILHSQGVFIAAPRRKQGRPSCSRQRLSPQYFLSLDVLQASEEMSMRSKEKTSGLYISDLSCCDHFQAPLLSGWLRVVLLPVYRTFTSPSLLPPIWAPPLFLSGSVEFHNIRLLSSTEYLWETL